MNSYLWQGKNKFLIDGFPRNKDNLDGWNKELPHVEVKFCLYLNCPEDIMEARLLERGKTSGRDDDNIESIKKRFKTYLAETKPIIEHFDSIGKKREVNSQQPVEKVFEDLSKFF